MPSKLDRAMDFLELIPYPSTHDIIEVSKKVMCSERWVWMAKKRLEEKREKSAEEFSLLNEISSDLKYVTSLLIEFSQNARQLTADEVRNLNRIGSNIIKIDERIVKLGNYGR